MTFNNSIEYGIIQYFPIEKTTCMQALSLFAYRLPDTAGSIGLLHFNFVDIELS